MPARRTGRTARDVFLYAKTRFFLYAKTERREDSLFINRKEREGRRVFVRKDGKTRRFLFVNRKEREERKVFCT